MVDAVEHPYERAKEIVIHGHSRGLSGLPIARLGDLTIADQCEIENYRSVANILREYVNTAAAAYIGRREKVTPIFDSGIWPTGIR